MFALLLIPAMWRSTLWYCCKMAVLSFHLMYTRLGELNLFVTRRELEARSERSQIATAKVVIMPKVLLLACGSRRSSRQMNEAL